MNVPILKKKLYIPCTWETRKPLLLDLDKVFFVPQYYQEHHLYEHNLFLENLMFQDKQPIILEYCSGNGEWIINKAIQHPDIHWIAIEKRLDRVKKIYSKLHQNHLNNLFIVYGEAEIFSQYYIPENALSAVFINFPDPWPKKKHAKHRLMTKEFLLELNRTICSNGLFFFTSDDFETIERVKELFQEPLWKSLYPEPFYINEWKNFGSSYFDSLWRNKNKKIYYLQYSNRGKGIRTPDLLVPNQTR